MSSRPIITGAGNDLGPEQLAPNRLEIHDLVKDKRQFSLYVQALESMMKRPYDDDFSFASIGGIHGLPYTRWGDSGNVQPPGGETFGGYCTHGSVLFPTWHRPYVALFEQSLYANANKIADEYTTDKTEWKQAALTLRAPFWDWARKPSSAAVPVEMTSPKVTIETPKGEETVDNPVYSYAFHGKYPVDTFDEPYKNYDQTLRYPTTTNASAKSDEGEFISTYSGNASQIRTQTFNCLTRLNSWYYFSNHTVKPLPTANSLESIHDNMHLIIGGPNGHMSDVGVAGFDASFWLHHANVDRLLSLWQALNPEEWVIKGEQPGGTYTIKDNVDVDATSDLTPFWNTQSTYWNSIEVRDWRVLHYSYPEFNGLEGANSTETRIKILQQIMELYGTKAGSQPVLNTAPSHDWALHAKFKKYELGSSFSILVYLGETYVGSVSAFTNRSANRCANCQDNIDIEIEGLVHLNEVLLAKYPDLPSLSPEHVKDILARDLSVRIQGRKADGTRAEVHDLTSLKIAPFSQTITHGPSGRGPQLPQLGDPEYHHDVLTGKPGHVPAHQWGHQGVSQ